MGLVELIKACSISTTDKYTGYFGIASCRPSVVMLTPSTVLTTGEDLHPTTSTCMPFTGTSAASVAHTLATLRTVAIGNCTIASGVSVPLFILASPPAADSSRLFKQVLVSFRRSSFLASDPTPAITQQHLDLQHLALIQLPDNPFQLSIPDIPSRSFSSVPLYSSKYLHSPPSSPSRPR